MSLTFRLLLIIAAAWAFRYVIVEIRKGKLQITDSLSWFSLTLVFILLALFPGIAAACANIFGIQSPVNLVYLIVIGLLVMRIFRLTVRISQMDDKLKELAREIAISETDREQKNKDY